MEITNKSKEYFRIHRWLNYYHGSAYRCDNASCLKKSNTFHWALKKGFVYAKERKHFQMLCASCHKKYDWQPQFSKNISIGKINKPIKLTQDAYKDICLAYRNYTWGTNKRLSEKYGVTKRTINWVVVNQKRLLA